MQSLFDSLWKDEDVIITYGTMTYGCEIDIDCEGPGPDYRGSTKWCGGPYLNSVQQCDITIP